MNLDLGFKNILMSSGELLSGLHDAPRKGAKKLLTYI
jgi:hypothetical protein